ncbi:hypothetical protein [Cylindrospermopsis raciborskii]|nr:hypothetical protein [Cylindrospermopsis raciborskii]
MMPYFILAKGEELRSTRLSGTNKVGVKGDRLLPGNKCDRPVWRL